MDWFETALQDRNYPGWLRSAAINEEGTVFAPAALTGNEMSAFLKASWDGVRAVIYRGHVFLPTTWLALEYPQVEMLCEKIESRVRANAAAAG